MEKSPGSAPKADSWILYPPASQQENVLPNAKHDAASLANSSTRAPLPRTSLTSRTIMNHTPPGSTFVTPHVTALRIGESLAGHGEHKTVSERNPSFRNVDFAETDSDIAVSDSELSTGTEIRTVTGTQWTLQFLAPEADSSDDEELSTPRPQLSRSRLSQVGGCYSRGFVHHIQKSSDSGYDDSEAMTSVPPQRDAYMSSANSHHKSQVTRSIAPPRFEATESSERRCGDPETMTSAPPQQHAYTPSEQLHHKSQVMQRISLRRLETTESWASVVRPMTPRLNDNQKQEEHSSYTGAVTQSGWLYFVFFAAGFFFCIAITNWKLAELRKEITQVKRLGSSNHLSKDEGHEWSHSLDACPVKPCSTAAEATAEGYLLESIPSKISGAALTEGNDGTEESLRDRIDRYMGWAWLANYD